MRKEVQSFRWNGGFIGESQAKRKKGRLLTAYHKMVRRSHLPIVWSVPTLLVEPVVLNEGWSKQGVSKVKDFYSVIKLKGKELIL